MQPKLRQFVYTVALVMVVFVLTNKTNEVSAVAKRPVANIISMKNKSVSNKPAHANINFGAESKSFSQTISSKTPSFVPPTIIPPAAELPAITVESSVEIAVERPDPYGSSPVNAEVIFKRSHVSLQVDSMALDVPFTVSGRAIEGTDYTLSNFATHVVHFPANVFEARVIIMPIVDTVDDGSRSVIFTLVSDSSVIPVYKLGNRSRTIAFVSEYSNHPVVDLTVNGNRGKTTINVGQPASINLEVRQATACIIWGAGFDGSPSLPTKSVLAGSWSAVVYPTENTEYYILCQNGGYRQPQISQVVRVTVLN